MMSRYCFERYEMTQTIFKTVISYDDDGREYETDGGEEVELLGYWAIYDRRQGYCEPIAYTKSADQANKIVEALNRLS